MSDRSFERRSEEIEDEIARTRADMDSTLDALQRKLSPNELVDQAMNYVRRNGVGDLMRSAGEMLRDNPVPVALIGLGAAWLLVDAMRSRNGAENHPEERYVRGEHAGLGQGAYGTAYGEASYGAPSYAQQAYGERDYGRDHDYGADYGAPHGGERYDERYGTDSSTSSHRQWGLNGAGDRGRRIAHFARNRIGSARETYRTALADRPLALGAASMIIGAAIGLLLPASRREDEALGEYRDQFLAQAQEAGREQVEKVQKVADEAWRAAKDRAKDAAAEQGLAGAPQPERAAAAQTQMAAEERGATPPA